VAEKCREVFDFIFSNEFKGVNSSSQNTNFSFYITSGYDINAVTPSSDWIKYMNLNQLKIFYLVIKRGSLTAAASELNITQPAVTQAVKRLQEHHDVRLVERPGKKLVLTEAGKELYQIAHRLFQLERLAEDCIRSFREEEDGHLRIQTSETFGGYYLPELINRYQRLHPETTVSVDVLPNEKVVEGAASLASDVGFISYPIRHPKLVLREILEERLVLIVAPDHPLARRKIIQLKDLHGQPVIMHEHGSALQKAMAELLGEDRPRKVHFLEFSNNEAIKRAVATGSGMALISEKAADEEIRAGKLKSPKLAGPPIIRKFYMVHHKSKYMSRPLSSLMDMVARLASARD
jgi:DNA-binding transcriptional LysR family regulator